LIGISPIENQYNNQVKIVRTGDENVFADAHKVMAGPALHAALDPLSTIGYYDCLFFLASNDFVVL
jgi:hypothetical protein